VIAALVAVVLFTVLGGAALALAGIDRPALAPATGIALAGVVLATAATAGIEIGPVVLAIGAAVLAAIALARRGHRHPSRPSLPVLIIVAWTTLQAALAAATPLSAFDGLVTWAFKAHALLVFGTPDSPPFDPALYPGPHPEYPILWPEIQATALRINGGYDDAVLRANAIAVLGCLLLGAYALLADRAGPWWSLAFLAPFAASPVVLANASAGNADAILAGLLAITLVATVRALTDDDTRLLPLAALFAAAAVLTKNEGLLGTVAILAAAAIVTRRRAVIVPALAAIVVYLPWRAFRAAHDLTDPDFATSASHLEDRLSEIPGIVATIAGRILTPSAWGVATVLALVVLALAPGRIRALAAVWAVLLGAGLTVSYLATSLEPGARLTSNAERTTLQFVLGLLCLAALALRRRRDSA
jgi:hypothetical protein